MKFAITQTSKIATQGEQKLLIIQKKFHKELEKRKLFGRDLNITITFETDIDFS